MKIATRAGMLAIGIVLALGSAASAERNLRANTGFWAYHHNRYCLTTMTGELEDCAYPTFQSCLQSSTGVGGTCTENWRFVDRTEVRPAPRHHRRVKRTPH